MKIIFQNTNGIASKIIYLPDSDIAILTETHYITEKKQKIIEQKAQYKYTFTQGTRNSKGVVILYNWNLNINIVDVDTNRNYLILNVIEHGEIYQIVGLYINPGFDNQREINNTLRKISSKLTDTNPIIIGGDLNCFKRKEDILYKTSMQDKQICKYKNSLEPFFKKTNTKDLWLSTQKDDPGFTHFSKTNATRIDQIHVSAELLPKSSITLKYLGPYDHKGLILEVKSNE